MYLTPIILQAETTASSSKPTYTDLITVGGQLVDQQQSDDNDPRLTVFANDIAFELAWTPKTQELLYTLKSGKSGAATHFVAEGIQYEIKRKRKTNRRTVEISGEVIE